MSATHFLKMSDDFLAAIGPEPGYFKRAATGDVVSLTPREHKKAERAFGPAPVLSFAELLVRKRLAPQKERYADDFF